MDRLCAVVERIWALTQPVLTKSGTDAQADMGEDATDDQGLTSAAWRAMRDAGYVETFIHLAEC